MQSLANFLVQLHTDVDEFQHKNHAPIDPSTIVSDLRHVCFNEVHPDEVGLCSSLLLNSEHNILKFLERTVLIQDKQFISTREGLLKFLNEYIKFLGKRVQDYAFEIKNTCVLIFRRDQSNTVKQASFSPLIKVIELKFELMTAERLNVKELSEMYITEYVTTKASQTVKANILKLLGVLSEHFPDVMKEKAMQLQQTYLESLNQQFKSNKPDMQIIAGAFRGLASFLTPFSAEFTANPKNIQTLYKYMCLVVEPNTKRFEIPKAALRLIASHAVIFRQYLTEDSEKMYGRISPLCLHTNKKLRDHAFNALDSFMQQVANELMSGKRAADANRETFKFFVRKFFGILEAPAGNVREKSIAIRGLGKLAGPIQSFMGTQELRKTIQRLFQYSESYHRGVADQVDETIHHLASFISSFANMLQHVPDIEETQIDHLFRLMAAVFSVFPQLHESQRQRQYEAIGRLFIAIYPKGSALQNLLARIIFEGLSATCLYPSDQSQTPVAPNSGLTLKDKTYFDLYPLWKRLLVPREPKDADLLEEQRNDMHAIIYDELMKAIIKILRTVDLDLASSTPPPPAADASKGSEPSASLASDPLSAVAPKTPKDYQSFLNLVDFCKLILPRIYPHLFPRWAYMFTREVIERANKHPLVSGFYKLLSIAMKILETQNYFEGVDSQATEEVEAEDDGMRIDDVENKRLCFILCSKFIKEVLARMQQFKDELLASCLQLVLSVPKQFVRIAQLVPALQMALRIGLSYMPLAIIGLNAIEYWLKTVPRDVTPQLSNILPYLSDYLTVKSTSATNVRGLVEQGPAVEEKDTGLTQAEASQKGKPAKKRQTINELKPVDKNADPLTDLQFRIIRLLGRIGGHNASVIKWQGTAVGMAIDPTLRIRFQLPFADMKPELLLDHFVPRVLELATGATDRQTKLVACELLHSMVLFMVGANANTAKGEGPTQFYVIYQAVFPALIVLATDVETVTRQLFEPLVFQLIHWFTKNVQSENVETMALLDSIVDSVGNATDGAVRDFAAKALAEFARWSLKQQQQQHKNPVNVKSLLKRLYSLAHHPNPYKRLGFALSLSQLYSVFREESEAKLVDQFVLEILHNCIFSLRLSHGDDASLASADKVAHVIAQFAHLVSKKSVQLCQANSERRLHTDLADFVEWVFKEIGRSETRCRSECMLLFMRFAPLLPGIRSAASWIQNKIRRDKLQSLLPVFEPTDLRPPSAAKFTMEELNIFLYGILTSLDCYTWVFSENFVEPAIFTLAIPGNTTSLFTALSAFLNNFAMLSADSTQLRAATPYEIERHNRAKTAVIQRLFDFIRIVREGHPDFRVPEKVIDEPFFELMFVTLLNPTAVGYGMTDAEPIKRVVQSARKLLELLNDTLEPRDVSRMKAVLKRLLAKSQYNLLGVEFNHRVFNIQNSSHLLNGYEELHNVNYLLPNLSMSAAQLAKRLLISLFDNSEKYTPLQIAAGTDVLRLALAILADPSVLLTLLSDETVLEDRVGLATAESMSLLPKSPAPPAASSAKPAKRVITKGGVFYTNFQQLIDEHISANFKKYSAPLLSSFHKNAVMFRVVLNLLDRVARVGTSAEGHALLVELSPYVQHLSSWAQPDAPQEQKENLLQLIRKVLKVDTRYVAENPKLFPLFKDAFIAFLGRSIPLSFKNEVFDMLGYMLQLKNKDQLEIAKAKINEVVVYDFPVNSTDLPKGSAPYNEYTTCLDKLLQALSSSGSLMLLEALFPILKEENHTYAAEIRRALAVFIESLHDPQPQEAFRVCYQAFQDENHQDQLRSALVYEVCIPILRSPSMTVEAATRIFIDALDGLLQVASSVTSKALAGASADEKRSYLMKKMCSFALLEAMYHKLPSSVIREQMNPVFVKGDKQAKGNELNSAVMKAAHAAKSEILQVDDLPRSVYRQYQCRAYNTLAAVVMATQSQENFYTVFCFKENRDKNELLWENIIDTEVAFKFEVETHFQKLQLSGTALLPARENRGGISSVYLANSSLSMEAPNMSSFLNRLNAGDLSDSSFSEEVVIRKDPPQKADGSAAKPEAEKSLLEMDPLNSSPCMPIILKLIDQMHEKFKATWSTKELPKWMAQIHTSMTDKAAHPNVLYFLAKIILNRPHVFEPYAQFWAKPLMELALRSNAIDYFVRDICILLAQWHIGPRDDSLTTQFMNHLIRYAPYPQRPILRANIDLLKHFTRTYKGHFTVFKRLILDQISFDSGHPSAKLMRTTGMYILDALLGEGYPLYDPANDKEISEFKFYEKVQDNLTFEGKEVYSAAAEVCGLAMKHMANTTGREGPFEQALKARVTAMFNKGELATPVTVLNLIGKHYPPFLDSFFLRIFELVRKLSGSPKISVLQIISYRAPVVADVFKRLQPLLGNNNGMLGLLNQRDEEAQALTLQILLSLLEKLDAKEIQFFLPTILSSFPGHPNDSCRNTFFDILMKVWELHEDLRSQAVTLALLKGMSDHNEAISDKLFNFWDSSSRLSPSTAQRLKETLSVLYAPEVEEHWLQNSTRLMVSLCRRTAVYDAPLFKPLTEQSVFREYRIDVGGIERGVAMTPMYATQSQADGDGMALNASGLPEISMDPNALVRATDAAPFSSSQSAPFSSADGFGSSLGTSGAPPSPVSGMSKVSAQPIFKRPRAEPPALFNRAAAAANSNDDAGIEGEVRLTKRFQKVAEEEAARRAKLKKKMREKVELRQREARAHKVVMYRRYRTGELPDVQIKPKDILDPLQVLSTRDSTMARLMYAIVFLSIYQQAPERDKRVLREGASDAIERVLRVSRCSAPVIGALERICFEEPELVSSPQLIGDTSFRSFNFHSGIMLLEKQILSAASSGDHSKKRKNSVVSTVDEAWAQLARLYEALGEEDILMGVYEKHIAKQDRTKKGLEAQLRNDYATALRIYEELTNELLKARSENRLEPSREHDLWENGRLECFVQLTLWNDLAANTLAELDDEPQNVWQPAFIEPYLRYFIVSHMKVPDRWPALNSFIEKQDSAHREVLEQQFSPELAFMSITRDDLDRARFYVTRSFQQFLSRWTSLHPLANSARHQALQPLQKLVEMEEFLSFVADGRNFESVEPVRALLSNFRGRWPSSKLDSVPAWDNVVSNRSVLFTKLNERFEKYTSRLGEASEERMLMVSSLSRMMVEERADMYRQLATGARKLGNLTVADHNMKECLRISRDKSFPFIAALLKLYYLKAAKADAAKDRADKFCKALKFISSKRDEDYIAQNPENLCRLRLIEGNILHDLALMAAPTASSHEVVQQIRSNQLDMEDLHAADTRNVQDRLFARGYDCLHTVVDDLRKLEGVKPATQAKAHLKFALLCDEMLKASEAERKKVKPVIVDAIISNMLDAMMNGSSMARDRFPRLLDLIAAYPDSQAAFKTQVRRVPVWMFIRWISQMMAVLDKPEAPAVQKILLDLAASYPQAIYYPFRISSENLNPKAQALIEPLQRLLTNPLMDQFVEALARLTHPEHRWKDWTEAIKVVLATHDTKKIRDLWRTVWLDCFDVRPKMGGYNEKFAKEWAKQVAETFGQDGSKLMKMEPDKFAAAAAGLVAKMTDNWKNPYYRPFLGGKVSLAEFSPWLSEFRQSDQLGAQYLEIPGQYLGLAKPQPEFHIRVSSFEPTLTVMGSLRKPKRLKIQGSDEREHSFLVKGGEDLRLDQRVQQLFSVMNEIFAHDAACCQRKLNIRTYQVVPMTNKVGILQWVDNTKPLKLLIDEQLAVVNPNAPKTEWNILTFKAAADHNKFIKKHGENKDGNAAYHLMFQLATRADAIQQVQALASSVPENLLKNCIFSLCASPEAYLALRSHFARTLATFSISSYIIGIGDRHLENFLLDMKTGGLIGIDFGHAFGTATQFLPVPELMPFRLTRQLIGFLRPLDTEGLLKHNMMHTLRALRENKDILLNTMSVFINEPLLDWQKLARRLAKEQAGGEHDSAAWFPKQKIEIALRKLEGDNPAYITDTEISASVTFSKNPACLKALREIVRGSREHNVRARVGAKCNSVKEQVDCLVDQATDPNILARTWLGWAPFV